MFNAESALHIKSDNGNFFEGDTVRVTQDVGEVLEGRIETIHCYHFSLHTAKHGFVMVEFCDVADIIKLEV